ncbi:[citrate (pro-3S)-lyase] ligase [Clostridium amazonitimonense]|uniref:[citrate (pro-3S)-lyase] ligase n=1 Tax=Clostridium amazonitimonense TaxID=1499689 RepID=UPI000509EA77|nr:[citrate (pro-3S)-lyase] ligase [Clostridium amazonitimonense]
MDGLKMEVIDLCNLAERKNVEIFLSGFDLDYEKDIDYTLVLKDEKGIVATCSKAKNILKCFAISPNLQGEGITATLITNLIDKLFSEGIYHSFIFTKPENVDIFTSLGFKLLYTAKKVALLESGIYDIHSYLKKLIKKYDINTDKPRSALVMNCNPFTNGHRYLIEKASEVSEEVLVFIVEENKSLFPFEDRYNLVKEGTRDLKNVKVIPGGEYIISSATFPSYFLRKEDDKLNSYTSIDAGIFAMYFCKMLNINERFVGEEPYCKVTNAYNEALLEELKNFGIKLSIVPRKAIDGDVISASKVRKLIKDNDIKNIKGLVPKETFDFLNSKKGKEIVEKIKVSESPH